MRHSIVKSKLKSGRVDLTHPRHPVAVPVAAYFKEVQHELTWVRTQSRVVKKALVGPDFLTFMMILLGGTGQTSASAKQSEHLDRRSGAV